MGQGCNSNNSTLFGTKTSDKMVQYTGPSIPSLGICTNDLLSEVDAVILQKIIDYSTGVGIGIPSIDLTQGACSVLFAGCIGCCNSCTDLPCLLACYKTAICTLYTSVTGLQAQIGPILTGYNTGCLTGVTGTSLINQVLQELILEFCTLQTNFNSLQTTVNGITGNLSTNIGTFLLNALTTCTGPGSVIKSGSGATASIAFKGFVPIGGIIPFGGVTAGKFDATGLGLAGTDFCGWAVANGLNGTVNMMGQVPVGLTNMGGSLPANATGLTLTTSGAQTGVVNQALTAAQIPSVAVSVSGTHTHDITAVSDAKSTTSISNNIWVIDCTTTVPGTVGPDGSAPPYNIANTFSGKISTVTQTLSGTLAGGGTSPTHNNMQPSTGLLYIQRIS